MRAQYSMEFIVFFAIMTVAFMSWMIAFSDLSQQGFEERDRKAVEDLAESIRTYLFLVSGVEPGFHSDALVIPDKAGPVEYVIRNTQTTLILETQGYGDYVYPIPTTLGELQKGRNTLWNIDGVVVVFDQDPRVDTAAKRLEFSFEKVYDDGTTRTFTSDDPDSISATCELTPAPGTCPTVIDGKFGDGVDFDFSDEEYLTLNQELFIPNDFTISVWFKPTDLPGSLLPLLSTLDSWYLESDAEKIRFSLKSGLIIDAIKDGGYEVNEWYNVILVGSDNDPDQDTIDIYLDGELKVDDAHLEDREQLATETRIASRGGGGGLPTFEGVIDELRIYERVLTDREIEVLSSLQPID